MYALTKPQRAILEKVYAAYKNPNAGEVYPYGAEWAAFRNLSDRGLISRGHRSIKNKHGPVGYYITNEGLSARGRKEERLDWYRLKEKKVKPAKRSRWGKIGRH